MSRQNRTLLWWTLFIVIVVGGVIAIAAVASSKPSPLDPFAQCLAEKKASFYGAYWCPHCNDQKRLFGRAAKSLPYIECSTPDGKGQLPLCANAGITGYPTWVFADGSKEVRVMTLAELAERTSCPLPADVTTTESVASSEIE